MECLRKECLWGLLADRVSDAVLSGTRVSPTSEVCTLATFVFLLVAATDLNAYSEFYENPSDGLTHTQPRM